MPAYTAPSTMPTTTPAFLLPPKSMVAVPDSMPCTPMTHSDMKMTVQPSRLLLIRKSEAKAPSVMPT